MNVNFDSHHDLEQRRIAVLHQLRDAEAVQARFRDYQLDELCDLRHQLYDWLNEIDRAPTRSQADSGVNKMRFTPGQLFRRVVALIT